MAMLKLSELAFQSCFFKIYKDDKHCVRSTSRRLLRFSLKQASNNKTTRIHIHVPTLPHHKSSILFRQRSTFSSSFSSVANLADALATKCIPTLSFKGVYCSPVGMLSKRCGSHAPKGLRAKPRVLRVPWALCGWAGLHLSERWGGSRVRLNIRHQQIRLSRILKILDRLLIMWMRLPFRHVSTVLQLALAGRVVVLVRSQFRSGIYNRS